MEQHHLQVCYQKFNLLDVVRFLLVILLVICPFLVQICALLLGKKSIRQEVCRVSLQSNEYQFKIIQQYKIKPFVSKNWQNYLLTYLFHITMSYTHLYNLYFFFVCCKYFYIFKNKTLVLRQKASQYGAIQHA